MKRNITINLYGQLYAIDEDAYELLRNYEDTLRMYFRRQRGGDEIVNDIEARIAELFGELKAEGVQAITIEHVQDIIRRMGNPEDIAEPDMPAVITNENDNENENGSGNGNGNDGGRQSRYDGNGNSYDKGAEGQEKKSFFEGLKGKRFFRDEQNKKLAGVLAGCANFFGGDVLLWRIGFVLLCLFWNSGFRFLYHWHEFHFGFWLFSLPVLAYILMAIIAPAASTPEERLRMAGKDVNAQNLADEVANEAVRKEKAAQEPAHESGARGCANGCLNAIALVCKFFLILLGLLLLFPFIALLIAFGVMVTSPSVMLSNMLDSDAGLLYQSHTVLFWVTGISLLVLLAVPGFCAVYALLSKRNTSTMQRLAWFFVWLIALVVLIGSVVKINEYDDRLWDEQREEARHAHIHDGKYFSNTDWRYFQDNGWVLKEAKNCGERYTSNGEYYTDDEDVRYLDAYSDSYELRYQAERREIVEPGLYRLTCVARAEGTGVCVYATSTPDVTGAAPQDTLKTVTRKVEVPDFGNEGGGIWHEARTMLGKYDGNDEYDSNERAKAEIIAKANYENGYGWSRMVVDSILVGSNGVVDYGVSTVPSFTGMDMRSKWFSACDFSLTKM